MVLTCCLWSELAWEAPQVLASLMATEQAVSASWMVQVWVALASLIDQMQVTFASLTVEKYRASASKVTWEQMALMKFHTQFPDGSLPMGVYG